MSRPRLLFIYVQRTSFVREDLALLEARYDVRTFHFDTARFASAAGQLWGLLYYGLKQALWLMREGPKAQAIYGWFVDYHLLLPVLFARRAHKPFVAALGGADCNLDPEIGYGVLYSRWRAPIARFIFHHATLLLPVTEALIYSESRFATWPARSANGVRAHLPDLRTPYRVVPTGYDPAVWQAGPAVRPEAVCTVGYIDSVRSLRLKGIDLFCDVARHLPGVVFTVVGVAEAFLPALREQLAVPANVKLLPPVARSALNEVYAQASVYVQLSRIEGLPNVVCEAMLCGCMPVGSAVGGIPDAIGEVGVVVDRPDPSYIAAAVREALSGASAGRGAARQRIEAHFHLAQRRAALYEVFDRLLEEPSPSPR